MSECEQLSVCPFFNDKMKDTELLGSIYKKKFCLSDNSTCARHMVLEKLGKSNVPEDLYPNMYDRAKWILSVNE
ncbi:MAG: hypothetical protein HQK79_22050 [Desulfobacterales bacterium]|nr:hypothetical protein [Desulfobacterales bacterium]